MREPSAKGRSVRPQPFLFLPLFTNVVEDAFCELRVYGVLRSSLLSTDSLAQNLVKSLLSFVITATKFIVDSSPSASINTNGVEEARQKGGKDRGEGIAARSRSRSRREHRKESVSMPFLLCADFGPPIFRDDDKPPPSFTFPPGGLTSFSWVARSGS
jgi:hypothetical protein